MATAAKFRIDVAIHDLLMNSAQRSPAPASAQGLTLPEPVFPQYPERLSDPGPEAPPEKRQWGVRDVYRYSRGWLFPYVRSRVLPYYRVPVCRVQVQSGLLVLLVVQQQSQGHDRGRSPALDRLAARQRLPSAGPDGWRTAAAAGFHP